MNQAQSNTWREEFGLPNEGQAFFASKADLESAAPESVQAHVVRRAFDLLELDGVLCADRAPLVYFKQVPRIDNRQIIRLHRIFWNHGGAPILVVITPDDVHVYSGLIRPVPAGNARTAIPSLVQRLDRASTALQEFLPSVESGEYFRRHGSFFDRARRVDCDLLDNLQATRQELLASATGQLDLSVLDALLCRLVFACYLFDREIIGESYLKDIGLEDASHLRDVLALSPRTQAKKRLYDLFRKLGRDFNGDLFGDSLDAEAGQITASHIDTLHEFLRATEIETGQRSFWAYDFAVIPIEAISAIYEHFLKSADREHGAVYTPRFLAELVLDVALDETPSLGRRYLDPAAGSGIFLVGLFNRIAEEWQRQNPAAPNDRRARELRKILCTNLCGIDINPTACRITAFSLYLAYLDQLSPRSIQKLQQKGHRLPRLVHYPASLEGDVEGNIWCGDFFDEKVDYPTDVDLVVGNPPWESSAADDTQAARWCSHTQPPCLIPNRQLSAAFAWKAAHHIVPEGRVCFVLPHGTLFNHSAAALKFQRSFFTRHAVDHVLNLVDYQFFLFKEARHPAIVVSYRCQTPTGRQHQIRYWGPKTDWLVTRADVISILPEDRSTVSLEELLGNLDSEDAPQIWKLRHWATARDRRLIDRLSIHPRLRDHVRQSRNRHFESKSWFIGEGFQPLGPHDDNAREKNLRLPSKTFIEATSPHIHLFVLPKDCKTLSSETVSLRRAPSVAIFKAPHVLVSQGFTRIAYADFDVSFKHALRGICGPKKDRDLLIFLAAYLRSPLARYFLFHTSSNWGVSRQKVHVKELLRVPFPLPDAQPDPSRAWKIVKEVSRAVTAATKEVASVFVDRDQIVRETEQSIEPLMDEYFDLVESEKVLVDDTIRVIIPSVRPTRTRNSVPALVASREDQREEYTKRLCRTLNSWAKGSRYTVGARSIASVKLGMGLVVLRKTLDELNTGLTGGDDGELLEVLARFRTATTHSLNVVKTPRTVKVFDQDRLYVIKPIGQRFWTETAALNDADEIAGSVLMHGAGGIA